MKTKLLLACTFATVLLNAQNTISVKNIDLNSTIAPNSVISHTVAFEDKKTVHIDFTNTGSTTNQYKLKRYDTQLSVGSTTHSIAYFCFTGQCFGPDWIISPTITLTPGQKTSDLVGDNQILDADFEEYSESLSPSIVKYTFVNLNNSSDSVQWTIKYNSPVSVGLKSSAKEVSSFEIYPSPVKSSASMVFVSGRDVTSKVIVYNSIGVVVYEKEVAVTTGRNKVDLQLGTLPSGVYFASMQGVTRKILVE